jgi:hypothetical protein
VSPNSAVSGAEIVIVGSGFFGGDGGDVKSVSLAGVLVDNILVNTNVLLVVHAGPNPDPSSETLGDVVIVAENGATLTQSNAFTYEEDGNITTVTPANGQAGTVVVIKGGELLGHTGLITEVTLNGSKRAFSVRTTRMWLLRCSRGMQGPVTSFLKLTGMLFSQKPMGSRTSRQG